MASFGTKATAILGALGEYVDNTYDEAIGMAQALASKSSADPSAPDPSAPPAGTPAPPPPAPPSGGGDGEFSQSYMVMAAVGKASAANSMATSVGRDINDSQKEAARSK